jgi:ubiquinone/menaquinone biosynthesis C-methylase UbiE
MDIETSFLTGMMELSYGQDVTSKLKKLSSQVSWAKGWPENKTSFWNAEAFMWGHKIDKNKREVIFSELKCLSGRNLDLGCGSHSYVKSVGFDLSSKMLDFNDNCIEKVVGDLEKILPFSSGSFESITAVFVLNYVKNLESLMLEIKRVLNGEGEFLMVLSSKKVNEWQRQKEVNGFGFNKWEEILGLVGFKVDFYEKEGLWFFRCMK